VPALPAPGSPDPWRRRLAIFAVALLVAGSLHLSGIAETLDFQFSNWLARNLGTRFEPDPRVAILVVDDATLRLMEPTAGRWPWPRRHLARLVESCAGAASVSLDVLLPESDRSPGDDEVLARAIRDNGRVALAGAFVDDLAESPRASPAPSLRLLEAGPARVVAGPKYLLDQFLLPVPLLAQACRSIGHANFFPSRDHLLRAYPYAIPCEDGLVPSLACAALQAAGEPVDPEALASRLGSAAELVFYNRPFPRLSAADLLFRPQTPEARIRWANGRHVLVGVIAIGAHEWRATPVSANFGGVEVHATALSNWLQGIRMRVLPPWTTVVLILAAAALPLLRWQASLRDWAAAVVLALAATAALTALAFWAVPLRVGISAPLAAGLGSCACRVFESAVEERRRRRVLEELQQMKRMLANMLLHDLNAPLSGMIMLLESTLPSLPADARSGQRIRNAIDEARRLSGILRNLLDIERMESGRMQVHATPVAWATLADATVARLLPLARARDVPVLLEIPADLRWPADAAMMERVLLNLLDNAIRHATPGTPVRVEASAAAEGERPFVCRVINRGPAIPAALRESIFEAFRTGAPSPGGAASRGRFGLGLAYCRLAIAAHGGHIACTSPAPAHGDGACFEFSLGRPGPTMGASEAPA
jgi:signal transduction histidine kinase